MRNDNEIKAGRRKFIKSVGEVGVALLTMQLLPSIARASGSSPRRGTSTNLIIRSGPGFVPHTHDLLIPYAVLQTPPPRGVKLQSTTALFHAHDVVLTMEQLMAVGRGGTINAAGGSHTFVIALAQAINE